MLNRKVNMSLIMIAAATALMLGATPATANAAPSLTDSAPAGTIVGNGYVIVNPAKAVNKAGQTFYPTGPIGSDTLVVIPDAKGNLPGGLTKANLPLVVAQLHAGGTVPRNLGLNVAGSAGAAKATSSSSATPASTLGSTYYSWSATSGGYSGSYAGGSIIGTDWSARAQYNFDTANGFNQTAVGLGKGHYQGYNGSTFGVWTTYYGVGSADDGGGGASVPWGEVADNEGFKAECATSTICWGDFWDF